MEVIAARVAAELRVYDARTLEIVEKQSLSKRRTSMMPTSIGIGGRAFYAIIAAPLQRLGAKSAAQAVARQAADLVADALDPSPDQR
jgi:hypothetical protein